MRISDWSSDVCSSDLTQRPGAYVGSWQPKPYRISTSSSAIEGCSATVSSNWALVSLAFTAIAAACRISGASGPIMWMPTTTSVSGWTTSLRSEEHTSELQSLMRISYAVFCLKKNTNTKARSVEHTK